MVKSNYVGILVDEGVLGIFEKIGKGQNLDLELILRVVVDKVRFK